MESISPRIQELTADILTGIIDGVIVTDAANRVLIWNRAAEEMTGIARADAIGRQVNTVLSDNPAAIGLIEKTLASGRSYSDYEAELLAKHGPVHPVGLVTSVLMDSEGMPLGVILTVRDQAGVRDLKERMRRSDRLATLGMIAAGIAHEIKNPLVGIRGAAQLMKSELRSGPPGKGLDEYLDVILKEADRLNNVLEGILDFTRIKPREMKGYNIHSILDRTLVLNEESARQSGVVLSRLYDPSLPDIMGNQDQLDPGVSEHHQERSRGHAEGREAHRDDEDVGPVHDRAG